MLLESCFAELRGTTTATVNCSAQTTAENAIQKLSQICGKPVSTNSGRVLRPRSSERLILYLKDVNLPRPDKYQTIQLISFLQQIIAYNGFYDENLEFIGLERVQVSILLICRVLQYDEVIDFSFRVVISIQTLLSSLRDICRL